MYPSVERRADVLATVALMALVVVLATAIAGLCAVARQARTNVDAARATFYERSHVALHIVAGATARVDRADAGRCSSRSSASRPTSPRHRHPDPSPAM